MQDWFDPCQVALQQQLAKSCFTTDERLKFLQWTAQSYSKTASTSSSVRVHDAMENTRDIMAMPMMILHELLS